MNQLIRKLRSKAGESLVESLASILIFTFASIILYTLVTTAGNLNTKTREMDLKTQADMVAVETGRGLTPSEGEVTITITKANNETEDKKVTVDVYQVEGGLAAYYKR